MKAYYRCSSIPPHKCVSGFSLVEIVLALMVMAIGIMALLALFPAGLNLSRMSYEQTRLAQAAETILNAVEVELRMRPELWEKRWGGEETREWPDGTAEVVPNTVPGAGNNEYNWHLHRLTNAAPLFNIWENEEQLAPIVMRGGNVWVTNSFELRLHANIEDNAYRYNLAISRLDNDRSLIEMLRPPRSFRLYSPTNNWPSANPATPGWSQRDGGLPPYSRVFHLLEHSPHQDYRYLSANMYRVRLRMVPGKYGAARVVGSGSQAHRVRDFFRYYYNFNNN